SQQAADETYIAEGLQLPHRQLPLGRARLAADEDHFARLRARLAEREEVLQPRRFVVLVDAQQGDVEVVARKVEVVRVAAEKRDRLLRDPDQTDVLEAAIAVEMVAAAVVEIDDVAARGFPFSADASRGQFRLDGVFRELERLAVEAGDGALDLAGHVADSLQPVDLDLRATHFFLAAAREETVGDEIFLRAREL